MLRNIFLYLCVSLISSVFFRCNHEVIKINNGTNEDLHTNLINTSSIRYAKRFSIAENKKCKVVYLFGNLNLSDTTATYIFLKDSSEKIDVKQNTFIFKYPCKKIASLSSLYTNMLCELGEIQHLAGIENIDYYNNTLVVKKHSAGQLIELSKNPDMDIEKTIVLNPDIIFNFGMGNPGNGPNKNLEKANIALAIIVDHLEESPLARAEWIKFFAVFVDKENLADSIFNAVEKSYKKLQAISITAKTKPSVFTEIKYGDIWYVPGGKSFMATLFAHANVNYIWKDDTKAGSLHLSFEEVYMKAKNADFWLNLSLLNSKKELYALEKRYSEFKAFKTNNLYNNNKITNPKGYSTYWEKGIMFPDKILSDLILIFHPELKSQINNEFNYYKKLN